jgi:hypothetical protein
VDFKQACKFYVLNYKLFKNPAKARKFVSYTYQVLQYKRKKLKSGAATFVFKQMFYGEWLICQWFEMEFTTQSGPYELQKGVDRTMALLD